MMLRPFFDLLNDLSLANSLIMASVAALYWVICFYIMRGRLSVRRVLTISTILTILFAGGCALEIIATWSDFLFLGVLAVPFFTAETLPKFVVAGLCLGTIFACFQQKTKRVTVSQFLLALVSAFFLIIGTLGITARSISSSAEIVWVPDKILSSWEVLDTGLLYPIVYNRQASDELRHVSAIRYMAGIFGANISADRIRAYTDAHGTYSNELLGLSESVQILRLPQAVPGFLQLAIRSGSNEILEQLILDTIIAINESESRDALRSLATQSSLTPYSKLLIWNGLIADKDFAWLIDLTSQLPSDDAATLASMLYSQSPNIDTAKKALETLMRLGKWNPTKVPPNTKTLNPEEEQQLLYSMTEADMAQITDRATLQNMLANLNGLTSSNKRLLIREFGPKLMPPDSARLDCANTHKTMCAVLYVRPDNIKSTMPDGCSFRRLESLDAYPYSKATDGAGGDPIYDMPTCIAKAASYWQGSCHTLQSPPSTTKTLVIIALDDGAVLPMVASTIVDLPTGCAAGAN